MKVCFLSFFFFLLWPAMGRAAQFLVFGNGDRLEGRVVKNEAGIMTFASVRFGEIKAPADEVKIEDVSDTPLIVPPVVPAPDAPRPGVTVSAVEPDWGFTRWWRPWTGRASVSFESLDDANRTHDFQTELRMTRIWTDDEVRAEFRYRWRESNDAVTDDLFRATGYWRHNLPARFFAVYLPTTEWNRNYKLEGIPVRYVLTQQGLGAGYRILDQPQAALRVGIAESWFGLWIYEPIDFHVDLWATSIFLEAEFKLPWKLTLRERGQVYHFKGSDEPSWENDLELSKQLTESMVLGLRHEYFKNRPTLRESDYSKLRVFIGYDF